MYIIRQIFILNLLLFQHALFSAEECNVSKVSVTPDMLSEKERQYLLHKHTIKMCVDPDWMPFAHINRMGKYEGILADYTVLFSQKLGIPFVLQKTDSYGQSRAFLKQGKCDIIVGEQATENTKKIYFVTKPYFETPRAFITRTDALLVHNFSQIAWSGKIGVLHGSPVDVLLSKRYPHIQLERVQSIDEGVQRVASGELIAFVNTLPALVYSIQKQGLTNVKISGTLSSSVKLSMLVNRDHPELVSILNRVIDTLTKCEQHKILNKWVQVKYEKVADNRYLKEILLVVLVILILLVARHYHLYKLNLRLEEQQRKLTQKMHEELEKNRRHQLMILQQNRFSQKGEMLNMIAHQWRQPLNTLSLMVQTFVLKCHTGKADKAIIETFALSAKSVINQMSATIDDFRNFFRVDKTEVWFKISEVVFQAVSIVQPILEKEDIVLNVCCPDEISVKGFPNELGQAIINIVTNAKDALVRKESGLRHVQIECKESVSEVTVTISDNGGGIDEEILPHIFDPYFTTKQESHGTGVGLYMSRIIVEEHMHGKLEVSNRDGGAVFVIRLPREGV